jgi:hypothetical protein
MTEQVIDIRDRIEKMRNEITVPSKDSIAKEKKQQFNEKNIEEIDLSKKPQIKKDSIYKNIENINSSKKHNGSDLRNNDRLFSNMNNEEKNRSDQKEANSNFSQEVPKIAPEESKTKNYRTYDDYQNDRVFNDKKESVKIDEKQPFPQFSLNVSNPISWKLMLLIMLMQLLTNMMLVVVLYLK